MRNQSKNEERSQFRYWAKTISKFFSVQLLVKALGMIIGIIIIRNLSKEDYAIFTISNSMQGLMNTFADVGVSAGLLNLSGQVWRDRHRFGELINTAMELRQWFAVISITIISPILVWLLIKNNASPIYIILITIAIVVELYFYLKIQVLQVVPQFHSQIAFLQKLDLTANVTRFTMILIASLINLNAFIAIIISTITSGFQSLLLQKNIGKQIDTKAPVNQEDRKNILKTVKTISPNIAFYAFQGQISIFLISIFGNVENIANVGAISRFTIIFSLIQPIMVSIIYPAFSRCQDVNLLKLRYLQLIFVNIAFGLLLILISFVFSSQMLWILGPEYSDLKPELILIMLSGSLLQLGGIMWGVNTAKGWINGMWLEVPLKITTQIILLLSLDLSSAQGVIIFGIISTIPSILLVGWKAYEGFSRQPI